MIGIWLIGAALAGGLHSGIPVRGVAGLGEPTFETPETGWTAPVTDGYVRIFVGRTESDATAWVDSTAMAFTRTLPPYAGPGDEAWGDGVGVLLFRDGNVGVLVRAREAATLGARLHDAIVDGGPAWPSAPKLVLQADSTWTIEAPDAVFIGSLGGRRASTMAHRWREPPTQIVAWDGYGRASVAP